MLNNLTAITDSIDRAATVKGHKLLGTIPTAGGGIARPACARAARMRLPTGPLIKHSGLTSSQLNDPSGRITGADPLAPGKHTIVFDFAYDGGGIGKGGNGTLTVDGNKVAEGRIALTQPLRFSLDESFDVGQDTGTPVIDEYDGKMPFKFTGVLNKVEIDLGANQLTPQKRGELDQFKRGFALRMQ
jgi:hypothetical protein